MKVREIIKELSRIWKTDLSGWPIEMEMGPHRSQIVGRATLCGYKRGIVIYPHPSHSPEYIRIVLVHELAHVVDYLRAGCKPRLTPKGRHRMHDSVYRDILREVDRIYPEWVQDLNRRSLAIIKRKPR